MCRVIQSLFAKTNVELNASRGEAQHVFDIVSVVSYVGDQTDLPQQNRNFPFPLTSLCAMMSVTRQFRRYKHL